MRSMLMVLYWHFKVVEPQVGTVWKFPNARIGYIAQHAFVHIEKHMDKTPNEYIRWRYQFGDDREGLDQANMKLSEKEEAELALPVEYVWKDEKGAIKKQKRVISRCTGQRRPHPSKKKTLQYELAWKGMAHASNSWMLSTEIIKFNKIYEKVIRLIDAKCAAREATHARALTQGNVEQHLNDCGLEPEYGTHFRIGVCARPAVTLPPWQRHPSTNTPSRVSTRTVASYLQRIYADVRNSVMTSLLLN